MSNQLEIKIKTELYTSSASPVELRDVPKYSCVAECEYKGETLLEVGIDKNKGKAIDRAISCIKARIKSLDSKENMVCHLDLETGKVEGIKGEQ